MSKTVIEVERRCLLDDKTFARMRAQLDQTAQFLGEQKQETHYLDNTSLDLRLQKSDEHAKVWLKRGDLHDHAREEIEVPIEKKHFDELSKLFTTLGHPPKIKWWRTRRRYLLDGFDIALDHTKGYGSILEVEKLVSPEDADSTLEEIRSFFTRLGLSPTPKEVFVEKFQEYEKRWREQP